MGAFRIEPEPLVKENPCERCGGTNRVMHGYVYDDEHAYGVYFVDWCDGDHPHKAAFVTIGLGPFWDGTDASGRSAFCVEWRAQGMRLTDKPAIKRPDLLGSFVTREAALNLPNIAELWDVADHIVVDDPRAAMVEAWLKSA